MSRKSGHRFSEKDMRKNKSLGRLCHAIGRLLANGQRGSYIREADVR